MSKAPILTYPRSAEIKRAIAAISKAGIVIGSVKITPTGELCVYAESSQPVKAANDFDEWERRGRL